MNWLLSGNRWLARLRDRSCKAVDGFWRRAAVSKVYFAAGLPLAFKLIRFEVLHLLLSFGGDQRIDLMELLLIAIEVFKGRIA
jgi:hypothetical protein